MFFIAGGTGFIGRHLIASLEKSGQRARCLVRASGKAGVCRKEGFESVAGDITEKESLQGALDGCDVLVHLVGIIEEKGPMTFVKVHVEGTRNLIDEAKAAGVQHLFYQSALGASVSSGARYFETKAEAEDIVKASGIPYTIFRPSLVIGEGDGFTEKLKELIDMGPFVPIPGDGNVKFQPMAIEDWVKCFMAVFSGPRQSAQLLSRIYELGGPEHLTYNEIVAQLMETMGINKPVMHIPLDLMKISLPFSALSRGVGLLLGKKIPSVTREQLDLLRTDNICARDGVERTFGFTPITYRSALKKFIRPIHGENP